MRSPLSRMMYLAPGYWLFPRRTSSCSLRGTVGVRGARSGFRGHVREVGSGDGDIWGEGQGYLGFGERFGVRLGFWGVIWGSFGRFGVHLGFRGDIWGSGGGDEDVG